MSEVKHGEKSPTNTHEERLSRVFDEVMGLGDFADSSSSPRSGGQDEARGLEETSGPGEQQPPLGEEESNASKQEDKTEEVMEESPFPHISPPSSDLLPSFTLGTTEGGGGGGGSGGSAFDDALDGLPVFGAEDEDEDWHFALPLGSLEDVNLAKARGTTGQPLEGSDITAGEDPFTHQPREDREGSTSSNTSHSSQEPTPENSRDGGVLNREEETETDDSQQGERSEAAPMEDSNPRMSPAINIKDEPIDEGYDAALLPQSSIRQIKEELEHQEEELRISSVYSVGGGNAFVSPTMPAAVPTPTTTAIFLPSRGAVLQAVASLRSQAPVSSSQPPLATITPRPPQPNMPGSVRCSGCCKILLKGQTAFQRKGSTQLFCSTVCLTGHLPPQAKNRSCFQCHREILQPRDMITIPADQSTFMHFCGQFCLSVFRHKKKQPEAKQPETKPAKWDKRLDKDIVQEKKQPEKPVERQPDKPVCSVCRVSNKIEHEVTHQGRLHRLCSDACFESWRKMRQLAMNCCEGCGLYCKSSSYSCETITIDSSQLNFCGPTCIGTYKQTCRKKIACAHCRTMAVVSSTIMERDQKGKVQLYCSSACVGRSRPPQHVLTGAAFPCSLCKVSAVPQYHLAMVDGTIRNFCSYDCVTTYRKSGNLSRPDLHNGTSSLSEAPKAGTSSVPPIPQDYPSSVPYSAHHPGHSSVPPLMSPYPAMSSPTVPTQSQASQPLKPAEGGPSDPSKLTCHQCSNNFNIKPVIFSHQGRISMFCSRTCSELYKIKKNLRAQCECCKQDKVLFDTINYNQQDLFFCSENCKLHHRNELTSRIKDHPWRPCTYCAGIGSKMLHSHYGGKMEEFCKPSCMSQYTVLFYGMGRCDSCRKQGYMTEKLQCMGSVRNFCELPCLLQYCCYHFEPTQHTSSNSTGTAPQTPYAPTQPHHSTKMNPVIADVVSLANGSATQPSVSADTALTGAFPTSSLDGKNLDHASTQTDTMRVPASRRRQMKNKSVLCRPFTMDQEVMCQLPTPSTESAAGSSAGEENVKVKVVMVPFPVPVFIPVPMSMYSQHTPVPMAMPIPIPVPLVVPPQKKEMKDAEVQSEPFAWKEEKEVLVSSTDQSSSYSGVAKSEVVTPMSGEKEESDKAVQANLPLTAERITESTEPIPETQPEASPESADPQPITEPEDITTISQSPSTSAEQQPPSPMMDLETDYPSEPLEEKSSSRHRGVKRPRDASSGRKRSRKRTSLNRSVTVVTPEAPKLNHLYGVKAWRSWVQQRKTRLRESNPADIKEDVFQCDSAELSFALSHFIREVRRPNGETYSPDSIFYLCLGIQQYLFTKGRIENIFNDSLYSHFAMEISGMLQLWKPTLLPSGAVISSRVMESYLWECKQLGAYSPIVLLNTLLFFCTKNFGFTTLTQHQSLSFTNFTGRTRHCSGAGKVHYLHHSPETERLRKRREEEETDLEMLENVTNPLHCPVRLYEFYLSRCPVYVKMRSNLFYLQPDTNVHTHSPHWYTSKPLEGSTLQSMLTRILAVKEVHQDAATHQATADADHDSLQ